MSVVVLFALVSSFGADWFQKLFWWSHQGDL